MTATLIPATPGTYILGRVGLADEETDRYPVIAWALESYEGADYMRPVTAGAYKPDHCLTALLLPDGRVCPPSENEGRDYYYEAVFKTVEDWEAVAKIGGL